MSGFGNFIGNAGHISSGMEDRFMSGENQKLDLLVKQAQYQAYQQGLQDSQQARQGSRMAFQALGPPGQSPMGGQPGQQPGGVPQSVSIPGAQQMPPPSNFIGQGQQTGGAQNWPIGTPTQGIPSPVPGSAPIRQGGPMPGQMPPPPMPQGAPPQGRPAPGPQGMPLQGQPPRPPAQMGQPGGQQGGGLTISQMVDNLRSQNPDADPYTLMQALSQAAPLLRQEEQLELKRLQVAIQQQAADTKSDIADWKMKTGGGGGGQVYERALKERAVAAGINPTGKTTAQLEEEVSGAAKAKADGDGVQKQRYTRATEDIKKLVGEAKKLITDHPEAVGLWSSVATRQSQLAGTFGFDWSGAGDAKNPNAIAARKLDVTMGKLADAAGVADSYGGQGGATMAKKYDRLFGTRSLLNTKDLLNAQLEAMEGNMEIPGDLAPAPGISEEDQQSLLDKYNVPQ